MDPKDRRTSIRQPIKLAAQIEDGQGNALPCQIADFCGEGLFIRYSGQTSRKLDRAFAQHQPPELVVRFRGIDGQRRHELHVRTVRRIDGAMGVNFTRSNPEAVNAMLQLCGSSGDQSRSSLRAPSERVQFVLHQCAKTVTRFIEPLMDACFVQTADALRKAAQKAPNDQLANEYMDAAGQLQARQRVLWHHMARYLESPLKPAQKGVPGAELSVVDKNEFEDWLTIRVMVTRADTLYRGDLLQLKLRLDNLNIANRTGHQNPLGPALVCEAFHLALMQLKATREVEKVCLKTFEQAVLKELAPLYHELNNILIRHGVLPDLDLSKYLSDHTQAKRDVPEPPKTQSADPSKRPPPAASRAAPEPASTESSVRSIKNRVSGEFRGYARAAQTAFSTVRNLLNTLQSSRLQSGERPEQAFAPNARPLSQGELHRELQELQLKAAGPDEPAMPLRERVVKKVKDMGEARLNDDQQETLDVVDRFFTSVVESPKLSDYAQARMRQLEVPVLKVVMRDPAFFEDQESPVRGVMNRLAQLGVKGGRLNPVVQRRVDELIQRIATEFEQDTGVFEQTLGELDTLIDRQNLVYRRNVERVTAAAEGAQKVAESKAAVAEAVDQKIAGRKVPRALVSLLEGGWRDLLSLTWIRQGADSQLWQDYLTVIDSLLAFADDPNSSVNLPELLRLIQDGLASISSNHMPSSQIRDELKQFLIRRPDKSSEMVEIPAAKPAKADKQTLNEREQRSLQRWVSRAQQLRTGDWLRDQTRPDAPQFIRLVWVARGFSRFVFVNHQGMRVVELDLESLARQMRKGIIVPDSQYERPLVDESIDRMVRNVYDQLSWASTHDELTKLLNRREFERMLEQQLARREDTRALLHLDLRGFRLLNDTAGSQAGDEALRQVAELICQHVGDGMPVARLGGNEFAMLVAAEQGAEVAEAVIGAIESAEFSFGGRSYQLSANAGLAPELPALVSAERWLRSSEQALSAARKNGPGKLSEYALGVDDQARQEQIAARVASLSDPDEERMLLRCQKIIPLHAEAKMAAQYEILISMYDDSGQLITGRDFVRMAERYDRMQAVDRWVVGHMLDWLRDRGSDPHPVGGVCINLSGHSLNDQTLLEFIYEKLSEKDAPIERLWFELTEASAIADVQAVADFMLEMKELGCRFCLGNFGSGPNSFQFMRSLPVDLIKIDSAFTAQLMSSQTDKAMVKSMVDMAHYMSREVIASQVESREVLDMLRQLGVDYAQGFVVEKPRLLTSLT
ncbi:MAG: EAL domain protein [Marinobacter excellens HL-55]|uniref:EAL domain protein n=1 Tax=Marinobacter excellens HL-55 TaxID=1305731 RepID=A0A0P8BND7_9GAMM|nr:MAG: EAL domain protein [Marinobacter excellens HL-55]